jgi:pimeloyl-ACP methyl ester carboxylesterase
MNRLDRETEAALNRDEIELETRSGTLAGLEWGKSPDHPLLALHGWLDNAASFARLCRHLRGCHVVAIDLPGHGKSMHRAPHGAYHLVDYADDVLNAADALHWRRFGLIGHSLGAGVASMIAGTIPERVTELILIDGIGPIANTPEDAPTQLRQALLQRRRYRKKIEPRVYPNVESAIEARKLSGNLSDEAVGFLAERGLRKNPKGVFWGHDRRLTLPSPLYLTEPQVLAFLRSIVAPTLLIKATRGILERYDPTARIASVKDISVVELPGGHHLHLEDPLPVADAILKFLADRATSGNPHCPTDDEQPCLDNPSDY